MNKIKKLELKRETIRRLQCEDLGRYEGGATATIVTPLTAQTDKVVFSLETIEQFSPASHETLERISHAVGHSIAEASNWVGGKISWTSCAAPSLVYRTQQNCPAMSENWSCAWTCPA